MIDDPNAVSSTATMDVADSSPAEPVEVEDLTDEQRAGWIKTGELPVKPKSGESATPKPGDATDKGADAKTAESGTAKKSRDPEKEARYQEILKDRESARKEAEQLKKELADYKAKAELKPDSEKNVASLATPSIPQPPEKPKFPNLSSWTGTPQEFDEAVQKAADEMMEYPIKKQAFDAATAEFEKQRTLATERQTKVNDAWKALTDKGIEIYGKDEWQKIVTANDLPIYTNDPVEIYVRASEPEIAAHLLQYFGHKKPDLERIIKLPLLEQFEEMKALEAAMRDELKLGGTKSEAEPPKKEVTAAKKPPAEVGGKGVSSGDPSEAALKRGDVDEYMRLENAKDIAKRKK